MHLLRSSAVVAVLSALAAAGCSSAPTKQVLTVTGTATYQGQKLTSGILTFIAANGDIATAAIQADGTFVMTDVVPGLTKVGYRATPQGTSSSSGPKTGAPAPRPVSVPPKFQDAAVSGVTVEVTKETANGLAVDLK